MITEKGIIFNFPAADLLEKLSFDIVKSDYSYTPFGDTPDIYIINNDILFLSGYNNDNFTIKNKPILFTMKEFGVKHLIIISSALTSKKELFKGIPGSLIAGSSKNPETFLEKYFVPVRINIALCPELKALFSKNAEEVNIRTSGNITPSMAALLKSDELICNSEPVRQLMLSSELKIHAFPLFLGTSKISDYSGEKFSKLTAEVISELLKFKPDNNCHCHADIETMIEAGYIDERYREHNR